MENIGVGVIGCGKIAESKHIPAFFGKSKRIWWDYAIWPVLKGHGC